MASSTIALRKVASSSSLFNRLVNPIRSASVFSRSFNTDVQMTRSDDENQSVDVERRPERSISRRRGSDPTSFLEDVFDPFSPTRSLSQILNLMDQFMENPLLTGPRGMGAVAPRRGWYVKEDHDALYLRIDMPGVDKDKVKVLVEQNTLIIKGEGEKESEDEEPPRYSSRIDIPPNVYKIDQIKAEMKNGVLKVAVPKVKEEERMDVHEVKVE